MLYQPSNVTPDLRAGIGQGVLDIKDGLTVSWHISGGSAMTAFEILILSQDAASTQLYTTGKRTDGCPAFGTSSQGEMLFFSYTIPYSDLRNAGLANGLEYKLRIKQYWRKGSAEKVAEQTSASVFLTRTKPTFSVSFGPTTVGRSAEFSGNYYQAEGDALDWFRWQITLGGDESQTVYDSGKVYGSGDISCRFDGFLSGMLYNYRLTGQTENGVPVDTDWKKIKSVYSTETNAPGTTFSAACAKDADAAALTFESRKASPAEPGSQISVSGGVASIAANRLATWHESGGEPFVLKAPWSIIWRGTFHANPQTGDEIPGTTIFKAVFDETNDSASHCAEVAYAQWNWRTFLHLISVGGGAQSRSIEIYPDQEYAVCLTPTKFYIATYVRGADGRETWKKFDEFDLTYQQSDIHFFILGGLQECKYFEILYGEPSQEKLADAVFGQNKNTSHNLSQLYSDFAGSGGVVCGTVSNEALDGFTIYRESKGEGFLRRVAPAFPASGVYLDFGAVSGGAYRYYLFGEGTQPGADLPIYVSKYVTPTWWNWTLMECEEVEPDSFFVLAAYRFRINVDSGTMNNNNSPALMQNFTKYPTIQLAPQNYRSGTLSGLIGSVKYADGKAAYSDTVAMRDSLFRLSTTQNVLFLKNRKGDLIRIRVSGPITAKINDASREQEQTVSIPWAEVGPADGAGIWATNGSLPKSVSTSVRCATAELLGDSTWTA